MRRELISVIIPTFNSRYIVEAIQSVISQTYSNWEIVVVDDGSTEDTEAIIKQCWKKIKYIRQDNKGPASARNLGVTAANGEFIAFLDADDIWLEGKLDEQLKYMQENPNIGLSYTDYSVFDESGTKCPSAFQLLEADKHRVRTFRDLILHPVVWTSTVMVKRDVFERVGGFDESMSRGEDYDLWLRIAAHGAIDGIPKVLAKYRRHADSLSNSPIGCSVPPEVQVLRRAVKRFPHLAKQLPKTVLAKRLSAIYFSDGYSSFQKGRYNDAIYHLLRALREWPLHKKAGIFIVFTLTLLGISWIRKLVTKIQNP